MMRIEFFSILIIKRMHGIHRTVKAAQHQMGHQRMDKACRNRRTLFEVLIQATNPVVIDRG